MAICNCLFSHIFKILVELYLKQSLKLKKNENLEQVNFKELKDLEKKDVILI
jgi:hypothetical protein